MKAHTPPPFPYKKKNIKIDVYTCMLNPFPACISFVPKMLSAYNVCSIYSNAIQMEVSTMNPFNPFMPNVFSHAYQLDKSISNFKVVVWYVVMIWVQTVCKCYQQTTKVAASKKKVKDSYCKANKKIPLFRVTRPYLNLLVKPRIFSSFLEKI